MIEPGSVDKRCGAAAESRRQDAYERHDSVHDGSEPPFMITASWPRAARLADCRADTVTAADKATCSVHVAAWIKFKPTWP